MKIFLLNISNNEIIPDKNFPDYDTWYCICSAWFLDIRVSICFHTNSFTGLLSFSLASISRHCYMITPCGGLLIFQCEILLAILKDCYV